MIFVFLGVEPLIWGGGFNPEPLRKKEAYEPLGVGVGRRGGLLTLLGEP